MTVELGDITLAHLTHIDVRERARIVRHPVPGLAGDLFQTFGRFSVEVSLQGVFYGLEAAEALGQLRAAYLERQPIDFFTAVVGEGYFTQVLITRLDVRQRSGYLEQFDYLCQVVEYVEPPEPVAADPFAVLNDDLLGEAIDFVDDVQNALAEVSNLVDLMTSFPNFGNPTEQLSRMLDQYQTLTDGGLTTLTNIRDLF
jgi:hypothetical protein